MIDLIKKSMLVGAGLTLLTAEKTKELIEFMIQKGGISEKEARDHLNTIIETSEQTLKAMEDKKTHLMNDAYAFWLYGVLSDEIGERAEKIVADILHKLHVPRQQELDELRERIRQLEQEKRQE